MLHLKKQQIGELLGAVIAALTIGGVLVLLDSAWGFGTTELAAPQATLMKTIVEGVMQGNLPWALVFIGVFIALVIEILGISVLPDNWFIPSIRAFSNNYDWWTYPSLC